MNFSCYAIKIRFSFYHLFIWNHSDEMRKNRCKKDPRKNRSKKYAPKLVSVISFISFNTKSDLFLFAPVFFLDFYEKKANSKEELKSLIYFKKILPPIELVHRVDKCNCKYKEIKDIFEAETNEEKEGNRIVVVEKNIKD